MNSEPHVGFLTKAGRGTPTCGPYESWSKHGICLGYIIVIVIIVTIIITIIIYTYINYIIYIIIYICVLMWDLNQQQWEYDGNKPSKWLLTGGFMVI